MLGVREVPVRKSAAGRRSVLTPEVVEQVVAAIEGVGLPYGRACILAGVPESTALYWRQRAEGRHPSMPPTPALLEFLERVERAEAACEAEKLRIIHAAGQGGHVTFRKVITKPDGTQIVEERITEPIWTAAAWFLERTQPDRYAKRERLDTRVPLQQKVEQIAAEQGLTPEAVLAEAQRLVAEG